VEKINISSGHTPHSTAAASILLMAEIYDLRFITKRKLAYEFSISDVTIAKTYREILPYKNIVTDDNNTDSLLEKMNNDHKDDELSPEIIERMKKFGLLPEDNKKVCKQFR